MCGLQAHLKPHFGEYKKYVMRVDKWSSAKTASVGTWTGPLCFYGKFLETTADIFLP